MTVKNSPQLGISVEHDCPELLNLTITEGTEVLAVSRKALSDLLHGHAGISLIMALRLDRAFMAVRRPSYGSNPPTICPK